jgi:hypothetical protein
MSARFMLLVLRVFSLAHHLVYGGGDTGPRPTNYSVSRQSSRESGGCTRVIYINTEKGHVSFLGVLDFLGDTSG